MEENKGGRPLKFNTVEELQTAIDNYFSECDRRESEVLFKGVKVKVSDPRPYTITGLALALHTTRDTLLDYESGKYDDLDKTNELNLQFSDTIKNAKLKIHNYAEESLWTPKIATGVIFNLKNNWKWEDKSIVKHEDDESELAKQKLKEMNDKLSKRVVDNS